MIEFFLRNMICPGGCIYIIGFLFSKGQVVTPLDMGPDWILHSLAPWDDPPQRLHPWKIDAGTAKGA